MYDNAGSNEQNRCDGQQQAGGKQLCEQQAQPECRRSQTIHLTSVRSISGRRTVGVCPKKNLFVEFLIDAAHGCTVQQV